MTALTTASAIAAIAPGRSVALPIVQTEEVVSIRRALLRDEISLVGEGIRLRDSTGKTLIGGQEFAALKLSFDGSRWTILEKDSGHVVAVSEGRIIEGSGSLLRVDLRPQRFPFRLIGGIKSRAELVALVPFEQYIAGVIGAELPRDWPLEVFKAQAIAARSFALARMRSASAQSLARKKGWMFEGTTSDQMFDDDRGHERAVQAARETNGITLTEHGQVVSAHYHSDCGGQTDEPATVWGGGPRFGAARDAGCPLNPRAKWRLVRSFQEIQLALQKRQVLPKRFQMASLQVTSRSAAGRALSVAVVDALSGRSFFVTGERLREALGFSELRSTLFEIKRSESAPAVEFAGRGFGHGSGLCQWGARQMALAGKDHREILNHYYPRLQITAN